MNILHTSAQKPNSTGSGVYMTELAMALSGLGHKNAVLAGISTEDKITLPASLQFFPTYYDAPNLPYPVLGMSDNMPYKATRYSALTPTMCKQFETAFTATALESIQSFQPDLLLCHHLYYLTALLRETLPTQKLFAICHGSDLRQIKKNPLLQERIKNAVCKLDHIFALQNEQREDIINTFNCNPKQVSILGTGYNAAIFTPGKVAPHTPLRLIYAGKIAKAKGLTSLLSALQILHNRGLTFELQLAGGASTPSEYDEIKAQSKSCTFKTYFSGKLSQQELAVALQQADLFVLPSYYEGLPLVLIEALACGLPIITTALPGIKPWLDNNIDKHQAVFITPPAMKDVDIPCADSLPQFISDLAKGIEEAIIALPSFIPPITTHLSWDAVARKVLATNNKPTIGGCNEI